MLTAYCERNKKKLWFKVFIGFSKFFLHFVLVCGLLIGGAFVFVELEERPRNKDSSTQQQENNKPNATKFWEDLQNVYGVVLPENSDRQTILLKFNNFLSEQREWKTYSTTEDYYEQFRKWFYFTTVAATTIGYGDVAPTSQEGRVFFIAFALLSVPAMLTLLARCGSVLTAINVHLFDFVYKCCCKKKELISAGMLSALTFFLLFGAYMQVGPILSSIEQLEWTYIDSIYFWFVTFTTIGFGDINYEINDTQYFLLLYRIFGLALLAGVIDSLVIWIKRRRENLKKLDKEKLFKAAHRMQKFSSKFTDKSIDTLQPIGSFLENKVIRRAPNIKNYTSQLPESLLEMLRTVDSSTKLQPINEAIDECNIESVTNDNDNINDDNDDDGDDDNDGDDDVTFIYLSDVPAAEVSLQQFSPEHCVSRKQIEEKKVKDTDLCNKTVSLKPEHNSDRYFKQKPENYSSSIFVTMNGKSFGLANRHLNDSSPV